MLQKEKEINKVRSRRKGPVLLTAGLCLIIGVIISYYMDYRDEKALLSTMEQLLQADEELPSGDTIQKLPVTEASAMPGAAEAQGGQGVLIGSLKIPCIGLEVPVVEGVGRNALRSAVGHMDGTAPPGAETGNCVIAGHRNYSFGRFFNRLDEVRIGDEIEFTSIAGESYVYQVNNITVVEPEDVSVLEPDGECTLTLITCTPIYIASHRLIVKAELLVTP